MRPNTILLASALALGAMLAGCSDAYFDRRDAVVFHAGDAVETNKVAHIIDPWPPRSANRTIVADGEREQRAMERYRTNKTTPLQPMTTSSVPYAQPGETSGGGNN